MRRRPLGRPRTAMAEMDKALEDLGGLRAVVGGMDAKGVPYRTMVTRLEQMTGVRVAPSTIPNWLAYWAHSDRTEVTAA